MRTPVPPPTTKQVAVLAASGYPRLASILAHVHPTPSSSTDDSHSDQQVGHEEQECGENGSAAAGGSRDLLLALGWLMARGGVLSFLSSAAPATGGWRGSGASKDERGVGSRQCSQTSSCTLAPRQAFTLENSANMRVSALAQFSGCVVVCVCVCVCVCLCVHARACHLLCACAGVCARASVCMTIKLTQAFTQLSESPHLLPADARAPGGLGARGGMGVVEEKDKVRAAVRCAMAAWRAMELNVRQVANEHARVVRQLEGMLQDAAPACRNREIASVTVPELLRLYSPGGPLHRAGKGKVLGPCGTGRAAAGVEAVDSCASDREEDGRAADVGGGRRREELREALWGWMSSAAAAPVGCQKRVVATASSFGTNSPSGRGEAGSSAHSALERVANLRNFLEQLAPLIPLLRERGAGASAKQVSRKAAGEVGDMKQRGRVARQVAIASAYGAGVPREGRGRGESTGAVGAAAGTPGAGNSGRGARERSGGARERGGGDGAKAGADSYLLLGGGGSRHAAGRLDEWDDGRWDSGEWQPYYRHAQATQAHVPLCFGQHWLWEPKMSVQVEDGGRSGSSSGGRERGSRGAGDHLELMVPSRQDLPPRGLVAGHGTGGGAARGRGLKSRVQQDDEKCARAAMTGLQVGGEENLAVEGVEERARLARELQERAACVAAAREDRLRCLRAVAVDLSRCSGVQWKGL